MYALQVKSLALVYAEGHHNANGQNIFIDISSEGQPARYRSRRHMASPS